MKKIPELPFERIYEIMREHPLSYSRCAQQGLQVAKEQREFLEGCVKLPSVEEIMLGLGQLDMFVGIENAWKIRQWLQEER